MKLNYALCIAVLAMATMLTSCGGKTTEDCKDSVEAYQFGRDMQIWVQLRASGLTLEDAINEYAEGMGVNPPYEADDACVVRGFKDAEDGKESPYSN
jgi:hypothetical protein